MKIYVINILEIEIFSVFTNFIHIPFIIISLHKYLYWKKLSPASFSVTTRLNLNSVF